MTTQPLTRIPPLAPERRPWRLDLLTVPVGGAPSPPVPPFYKTADFAVHRSIVAKAAALNFPE